MSDPARSGRWEDNGLEHCPSGLFAADEAWLACAVLANAGCDHRTITFPGARVFSPHRVGDNSEGDRVTTSRRLAGHPLPTKSPPGSSTGMCLRLAAAFIAEGAAEYRARHHLALTKANRT